MNAQYWHNVTPKGSLSSAYRAVQEQSRYQKASRSAGVLLSRTPRGTFIRSIARGTTNNDGGTMIPRWG